MKLPDSAEVYVIWPNLIRDGHPLADRVWRVRVYTNADDPDKYPNTDDRIEFTAPSGEFCVASPVSHHLEMAHKGMCSGEALWGRYIADVQVYTDALRLGVVNRLHERIKRINKQKFVYGDTQRPDGSWIVLAEGFNKLYPSSEPT